MNDSKKEVSEGANRFAQLLQACTLKWQENHATLYQLLHEEITNSSKNIMTLNKVRTMKVAFEGASMSYELIHKASSEVVSLLSKLT